MIEEREKTFMEIAIIYDSKTNTTEKCARYIAEGIRENNIEAYTYHIKDIDADTVKQSDAVIIGSPTYCANVTSDMVTFLQSSAPKLCLAGKLGGAFATEQYIHGGGEKVIETILAYEMVFGMMTYSGGGSCGKPVIHLGPVGMSQNVEDFRELFLTYGDRFAKQLLKMTEK